MSRHRRSRVIAALAVVGAVLTAGAGPHALAQVSLTEGYRLVDTWTTRDPGGDVVRLHQPVSVDAAPDDSLFVVDQQGSTVYHLDSGARVLAQWVTDTSIGSPAHVSASADRVYVTGVNAGEVRTYDGRLLRLLDLPGVSGVDVGPDGRVYVPRHTGFALAGETVIDILNAAGDVVSTWVDDPFTVLAPRGVSIAPDGRVFLAADGVVYVWRNGAIQTGLRAPTTLEGTDIVDVSVDTDDRVFAVQVASTRRVLVWTASSGAWREHLDLPGAQSLDAGPGTGLVGAIQLFGGFTGLSLLADRGDLAGAWEHLGETDETLGKLDGPRRLATSPGGDVFVVDNHAQVQRWGSDGTPLEVWPVDDRMPQLSDVAGGADDPCVAGSRVVACLAPGRRTAWSATPAADGWLVAGDGSADEWAAVDLAEQRVYRFSRGGQALGDWSLAPAGGFTSVADIAVDGDRLYYVDRGARRIKIVGLDGQTRPPGEIEVQGDAERIAARDGNLYALTREGWIWKYDADGTLLTLWRPVPGGAPGDLAAGPAGRVYVADPDNDRVLVFEPGGPVPTSLPPEAVEHCVVDVDKQAAPASVTVGSPVEVILTVSGACPYGDGRLDIVLAIDQSGSMTGSPLAAAQAAAIAFLGQIDPAGAQVAVIGFSTSATVLQSLTGDLRDVVRAVGHLTPGGQTNYGDALANARSELTGPASRAGVPKVLVLMTDGKPTDRTQVIQEASSLKAAGVTIYTIGLGANLDPDLLQIVASEPALYFEAPGESELAAVYTIIARRIAATRLLRTGVVVDRLPPDMTFVAGSAHPQAAVNGATLTWSLADIRTSGTSLTYEVRPRRTGHRPTNIDALLDYVDATGQSGQATFPVPYVDVHDVPVRTAYLPFVWRNQCKPQRADVVLVLDSSTSMNEPAADGSTQTKLAAELGAVRAFLDQMALPDDRAGIVTFDYDARLVQRLTGARGAIELALAGIDTAPGTRIDRGLGVAFVELVSSHHLPRNNPVIVVLSDGVVTPGWTDRLLDVAFDARVAGITMYAVGLGPDADIALLGRMTGDPARVLYAPDATALAGVYRKIAGRIQCN